MKKRMFYRVSLGIVLSTVLVRVGSSFAGGTPPFSVVMGQPPSYEEVFQQEAEEEINEEKRSRWAQWMHEIKENRERDKYFKQVLKRECDSFFSCEFQNPPLILTTTKEIKYTENSVTSFWGFPLKTTFYRRYKNSPECSLHRKQKENESGRLWYIPKGKAYKVKVVKLSRDDAYKALRVIIEMDPIGEGHAFWIRCGADNSYRFTRISGISIWSVKQALKGTSFKLELDPTAPIAIEEYQES